MQAELKQRFLVALPLAAAVPAGLWWGAEFAWPLLLLLILLLAAWEWAGLLGWGGTKRWVYVALVLPWPVLGLLLHWSSLPAALAALACWSFAAYRMLCWQHSGVAPVPARVWPALLGIFGLGAAVACLADLARAAPGPLWVLCLLTWVWLGESVAFGAGRRYGRRRLAPLISPGKTWEGALLGTAAVLGLAYWQAFDWLELEAGHRLGYLLLAAFCQLWAILGDLVESMLKRLAGLKDSGRLLPGHGGVLDRIDGLLAATPVFYLGVRPLYPGAWT